MPLGIGQELSQMPIREAIDALTSCAAAGNPLAEVLRGDPRAIMQTGYGLGGTQFQTLDGLDNMRVSKAGFYTWMVGAIFRGLNGQVVPDQNYVISALGGATINLATDIRALVLAWVVSIMFPLNNVTPTSTTFLDTLADWIGDAIVHQWQMTPCGIIGRALLFPFTIVKNTFQSANQTCSLFPYICGPGFFVPQNTGAFIAGGQVAAQTRVVTGLQNTTILQSTLGPSHPAVSEVTSRYPEIWGEWTSRTVARNIIGEIERIKDNQATLNDQLARGIPVQAPVIPTLQEVEQSPLVQQALDSQVQYFPVTPISPQEQVPIPTEGTFGDPLVPDFGMISDPYLEIKPQVEALPDFLPPDTGLQPPTFIPDLPPSLIPEIPKTSNGFPPVYTGVPSAPKPPRTTMPIRPPKVSPSPTVTPIITKPKVVPKVTAPVKPVILSSPVVPQTGQVNWHVGGGFSPMARQTSGGPGGFVSRPSVWK